MTLPLPYVRPYAFIFWLVFLWSFWPEMRFMRRAKETTADKGSMRVILIGNQIATFIAFFVAVVVPQFHNRVAIFWLGTALLVLGALLRRHCFRTLGQYFTYAVTVAENQRVIDRGAYRWVRHPSYTGGILMFSGVGLALGNWVSFLLLFVTTIAAYSYRVTIEERALLASIGEPYREYISRRKRFIPFVI